MYSPFLGELDEKTGMARTSVHLGGGGGHFLLMPLSLVQFSLYFRKSYSFLMGPI